MTTTTLDNIIWHGDDSLPKYRCCKKDILIVRMGK